MENKMAALDIANDSGIPTSAANKKAPQPESNTSASKQTQPGSVASSLREQFLSHKSPLKIPIVDPAKTTVLPTAPVLTADQQAKYDILLEKVKEWKEIPAEAGKGGPVTESEIMWMSRECLLRYLRATKWDNAEAAKRLLGTLSWRREYGVEDLTSDYISPENETGKQVIFGYDLGGRPCQYLSPGRQNTEPSPKQVQHLVFMVERSIDLMLPGVETLALLISFQATKNMGPGMGLARDCLNILQTHYPERLGKALLINIPWLVNGFLKLISPFIDPMTKEKLKFNCDMRQFVPTEQLWTEFQGDLKFEYDHKAYWSAFNSLCEEKAAEKRQRWVDGGKHYGESEMYMRGGDAPSVGKGPALEIEKVKVEENGGHVPPVGEASAAEMSEKVREKDSAAPGTQSNGNMDVLAMPA